MGPTITATVYGTAAVLAAYFFRPRILRFNAELRAGLFWLVSTPILFLIVTPLFALILCGVFLAALAPMRADDRAAFYVMTIAAVPPDLFGWIPFPGLNYLISLTLPKVACLCLLAPAIFLNASPPARRFAPAAGVFMITLTVLFSLQEFRSANLTSSLRATVDYMLLFALPFMGLIRLVRTRADIEKIFAGFVFVALIFFFTAAISQATKWNFYTFLLERAGQPIFAERRFGFLRVSVTLVNTFVGFVMSLGLIGVEYFRAQRQLGALTAWTLRALFLGTALITFSRGAWVAVAAAAMTFYFFAHFPRGARPILIAFAVFVVAPLAVGYLMTTDLDRLDPFGTFEYRRKLVEAAFVQFQEKPFFGDPHFLESGNFDHLYQGQGIIDVVNYYIQILMAHGLFGLGLFIAMHSAVLIGALNLGKSVMGSGDRALELQRAAIVAANISYLLMMATISAISLGAHLGVLIVAISTAFLAATRLERAAEGLSESAAASSKSPKRAIDPGAVAGDLYG